MVMKYTDNGAAIERAYRGFAWWAARRAWEIAGCRPCEQLVLAVEAYLRGETDFSSVRAARQKFSGGVAGAGIIGMPRAIPSAAAQLAAWHSADDSAEVAARAVIRYTASVAGFHALQQAKDSGALGPGESASSWRNDNLRRRMPDIESDAQFQERTFLETELQRWLSEAKN